MNKEVAREIAEVMLAYADGKKIEVLIDNSWVDVPCPTFNWEEYNYRVKPERKIRRMTHREFNRWYQDELVKGTHPQIKDYGNNIYSYTWYYDEAKENYDLDGNIMIRTDEHPEWHEPLIEE